eukprot:scaffold94344_cov64-Cyclotella_meneghiniana.AAC.2
MDNINTATESKRRNTNNPVTYNNNGNFNSNKNERGKRIPCPIDPSHMIYESALEKHVLKCPAAKLKRDVVSKAYYSKDVNRGGFGDLSVGSVDDTSDLTNKKHGELAVAILRVFYHLFISGEDSTDDFQPLSFDKLKSLTENEIYSSLDEIDLAEQEEQSTGRLSESIARHRIKAGGTRHLHQIASILGHLRDNRLLTSTSNTMNVIEMGAGRGMLGLVVSGAAAASTYNSKVRLFLVDRSGTRAKAETRIRSAANDRESDYPKANKSSRDCLKLDAVEVTRIKADLAHVHMPIALPFISTESSPTKETKISKTVVIAKHLCGSGTDLALKSLHHYPTGSLDGCVMATCCHGLCDWNDYVGRNCLLKLFCSVGQVASFGKQDFDVLKRWTSASVLDDSHAPNNNSEMHHTEHSENSGKYYCNVMNVVKELGLSCGGNGLGRACQRIIDYGRCDYMRSNLFGVPPASDAAPEDKLFDAKVLHYVPRKVTPQNAILLACKKLKS